MSAMQHYWRQAVGMLVLATVSACGGSSGDEDSPPPPPPANNLPTLSISDATADEGDNGPTDLVFTVTLSAPASSDVTVDYATADDTALAGIDYTATSGTLTIPGGGTAASIVVLIISDTSIESEETFTLALSNLSANARLGSTSAVGTILDDDEAPRQFTKLDTDGTPLADQAADYAVSPWSCVRDEATGRVWEVKTPGAIGLHASESTYTRFDDAGFISGIVRENGGECDGGANCDTQKLRDAVNAARLCGFTDWRLPSRSELLSLLDYAESPPSINGDVFPNNAASPYWSDSTSALNARSWVVDFGNGTVSVLTGDQPASVRLLRVGE